MRTARDTLKNICKTSLFFGVRKHIQKYAAKTPVNRVFQPSGRAEKQPERAVTMAEFPQRYGTSL